MSFGNDPQAQKEHAAKMARLVNAVGDTSNDTNLARGAGGSYHCKVCLTVHPSEANYIVHTQGKRHKMNIERRDQHRERTKRDTAASIVSQQNPNEGMRRPRQANVNAPIPAFDVMKYSDVASGRTLCISVQLPHITGGVTPAHRIMSSHEQKAEIVNPKIVYLLVACEPYRTAAFKVPNQGLEQHNIRTQWDPEKKVFTVTLFYPSK